MPFPLVRCNHTTEPGKPIKLPRTDIKTIDLKYTKKNNSKKNKVQ